MGREEQGRTWCMDAAQLDTQRKKEEAILKTSSTTYSTNRSSSSTRPAKLQLDRAEKSTVYANSMESDEKLRKDVKSLNEKLDKLILAQSTMKKVNFVSTEEMEPVQEREDTQFAEVCYMSNGQGGYNKGYYNYKSNSAMSYRNTDVANPQDQVYLQQQQARSSQAQQHGYGPKNNYQGPQGTFPSQKLLQGQADGVVDTSKKHLPGKAIQNRKEQCKVIFTQEGLDEEEDQERVMEEFCLLLHDEEIVVDEAPESSLIKLSQLIHHQAAYSFKAIIVQDVLAHKEKVSELMEMSTHQINLLTSPTFLPKVKDQGKFTLPCTLGHIELDNALVDSGASINLISLTMAETIGIVMRHLWDEYK
ncbi:unnamed protein product [Microthlaspi erraticum]|uniref:Aspartic peptidase DDI1-type domain-containing protein n=1 Tax=Microthlaspi erraticum TaxID=1685480 RepID=A0A6D2JA89_9BRAS|nr:unnamed protein product [Microthlaspi erraticum]